ncbi:hypothetical protein PINS_up019258 [Pythium insidiosum]|nr:hypothetical protein PINS_up019258 [Pythium insidiosum]
MSLDEDQLSVLNLIIDSYTRHEEWRVKVSDHLKAIERAVVRDRDAMEVVVTEYAHLWEEVIGHKKEGIDAVQQSESWSKLTEIERQLPFEVVVSLRNKCGAPSTVGESEFCTQAFFMRLVTLLEFRCLRSLCHSRKVRSGLFSRSPKGNVVELFAKADASQAAEENCDQAWTSARTL